MTDENDNTASASPAVARIAPEGLPPWPKAPDRIDSDDAQWDDFHGALIAALRSRLRFSILVLHELAKVVHEPAARKQGSVTIPEIIAMLQEPR